ncbi:glycosyltransferase family 2 protein [Patescibacteria group bacterium]
MKIFIVVPAHNEEKRISVVLKKLQKTRYKTIVVDDGSTDNTYKISKRYCDWILKHSVNLGKGAAMKTGIEGAIKLGADAIVFMDSDGQHEVTDLSKFTKKLNKGYDIVYGSRQWGKGVPAERLFGNRIVSYMIKVLFKASISDILCGYRALTVAAYRKIIWESSSYAVETEMIIRSAKNNLKYCEVPVAALYLEDYKGMTFTHAFSLVFDIFRWRINI